MSPFFSVIVPVYKVEDYLRECVDSILGQRFADFELILVDDGSPDTCPAICDGYAAADARVRVIHKDNGGPNSSRNAGISAALGAYICFADSDDYVEPDWLQTIHDDILANDSPDMLAYGYYVDAGEKQTSEKNRVAPGLYDKAALERDVYPYMLADRRADVFGGAGIYYNVWSKAGRRELFAAHRVRDERISVGEDAAMVFAALCGADSLFISEKPLYHYRIRGDSIMTGMAVGKRLSEVRRAYDYMKKDLAGYEAVLGSSLSDWYTKQLMNTVYDICTRCGTGEAVSSLRRGLQVSRYLQEVRLSGLPFRICLFILPMKLHMVFVSVLMQKIVNRIYS